MTNHDPIAYAYDADVHCPECAAERFGDKLDDPKTEDSEGNTLGVMFSWDEGSERGTYCGDCSAEISAPWCEGCDSDICTHKITCDACGEETLDRESWGDGDIGSNDMPSFCSEKCYRQGASHV